MEPKLDKSKYLLSLIKLVYRIILGFLGINLMSVLNSVRGTGSFIKDLFSYITQESLTPSFKISFLNLYPHLSDKYTQSGTASGQYFHQDLWAARKIFEHNPKEHYSGHI